VRSRLQLKSTLGERWKACAYLFFYVLPAAEHAIRRQQNCVLGEKSGRCCCIVPIVCVVQSPINITEIIKRLGNPEKITLLAYSWISRVCLLGEDRQNTADRESA
jgi:hypothetical protein